MQDADRIRPFAKRPPNRTAYPELRLFYFSDGYDETPHIIVTTSKGEQEALPLSDDAIAHHFAQLAKIIEHRFKQKMGLT